MHFSILKPLLIDECFSNVLYLNYVAKVLFMINTMYVVCPCFCKQNRLRKIKRLNKYNTEKRGINRYEYSNIQTGERGKST